MTVSKSNSEVYAVDTNLQPVFDIFHRNGRGKGIDETSTASCYLEEHHAVGSHVV